MVGVHLLVVCVLLATVVHGCDQYTQRSECQQHPACHWYVAAEPDTSRCLRPLDYPCASRKSVAMCLHGLECDWNTPNDACTNTNTTHPWYQICRTHDATHTWVQAFDACMQLSQCQWDGPSATCSPYYVAMCQTSGVDWDLSKCESMPGCYLDSASKCKGMTPTGEWCHVNTLSECTASGEHVLGQSARAFCQSDLAPSCGDLAPVCATSSEGVCDATITHDLCSLYESNTQCDNLSECSWDVWWDQCFTVQVYSMHRDDSNAFYLTIAGMGSVLMALFLLYVVALTQRTWFI